ncbi:hemicentin-1-like [Betta splendens]|uniref:Hemicentin-1-like n=1 Tax=Betta splendens TaxID=158456 RepID=A0A9W2Y216_BETSP|nr:hemicentin-1-like [Betta splendens]
MVHHSASLLLLISLAGFSVSEAEDLGATGDSPFGPSSVEITGVDVVTVGIPYGFECWANCYPGCRFTWTRGNVTSEGQELNLQLRRLEPTVTVTCTALNPESGRSLTVQKRLQVTEGPSNIQISGPPMLTYGAASNFTCSADCYPSCTYSWTVLLQNEAYSAAQGARISVSPPASTVFSETLLCKAEDTVSQLFISTTLSLWVASQSDISIQGANTVTMGKQYTFVCLAECIPSCSFVWKYMGTTYQGDQVQLPIMHQGQKPKFASHMDIVVSDYSKTELLTCEATNTVSHVTISAATNLTVIDPFSVRPTSQAVPMAGEAFSLECVGSQNPVSITWLRDKDPVATSQRVAFAPDNVTVTFSPLLPSDDGSYRCVVAEGGAPVQSVPYMLNVNYGPSSIVISGFTVVTAGTLYHFQCSASCYPTCQFTWTWGSATSQGPELSLRLGEQQATQNLTCTAVNPTTGASAAALKTLRVTAGPSNVHISGPAYLTAGVASEFSCSADCYPSCSYTWAVMSGNGTLSIAQGDTVQVLPAGAVDSETLVCNAQDVVSHANMSATLSLTVARLSDITIAGTSTVAIGKVYTYICSAVCVPSCTFAWEYMGKTFQGDQIQIPILPDGSYPDYYQTEALTCQATNTLTQATIAATKNLTITEGPANVVISGPDSLEIGVTASFTCSAECIPPCSFTWTLYGRTVTGSSVDITVNNHVSRESISCRAENPVSGATGTANETLGVSDPRWCGC